MTKDQRIKKRHRAEARFKLYGLVSIILALTFVGFLVFTIFSKGSDAFSKTTIKVNVSFNAEILSLPSNPSLEDIQDADYYDLALESINKLLLTSNPDDEKLLKKLFSPDFDLEIKNYLVKNPDLINQTQDINLTSSDDIDQLFKGNFPRDIPEDRRQVNDRQLEIFDELVAQDKIQKKFNNYFFTNGDSRDPELAGIGASLLGSFFSVVICLILSFPIAILASIYL